MVLADTRAHFSGLVEIQQAYPEISVYVGDLPETLLDLVDEVVVSPGVSLNHPFVKKIIERNLPLFGDVDVFARDYLGNNPRTKLACITGSNGKSTVTTWLGYVLEALKCDVKIGGNIGTPVLELATTPAEYTVLELSSFQLDTTHSLKNHIACILNVTPDHLDRYDSFAHYTASKQRIFHHAHTCIYNLDDPLTHPVESVLSSHAQLVSFSLYEQAKGYGLTQLPEGYFITLDGKAVLNIKTLGLKGLHNAANAMVVLAYVAALGLSVQDVIPALCSFKGLSHRCENVGEINHVQFVNDSKATNIGSTEAALKGLGPTVAKKGIHLILGGDAKGATFETLSTCVKQYCGSIHLIGVDAPVIERTLSTDVPIMKHSTLFDAVSAAYQVSNPNDMVLLSPACASFDMFSGFDDRGRKFVMCVEELSKHIPSDETVT